MLRAINLANDRRTMMKAGKRLYGVVEGEVKKARKCRPKPSIEDYEAAERRKKRLAEREKLKSLTDKIQGKVRSDIHLYSLPTICHGHLLLCGSLRSPHCLRHRLFRSSVSQNRRLKKTMHKVMSMRGARGRGSAGSMTMAETAANIKLLLEKGDAYKAGKKEVDKGVIRVRNSILTTNLKAKEKQQAQFLKIFEQGEQRRGAKRSTELTRHAHVVSTPKAGNFRT